MGSDHRHPSVEQALSLRGEAVRAQEYAVPTHFFFGAGAAMQCSVVTTIFPLSVSIVATTRLGTETAVDRWADIRSARLPRKVRVSSWVSTMFMESTLCAPPRPPVTAPHSPQASSRIRPPRESPSPASLPPRSAAPAAKRLRPARRRTCLGPAACRSPLRARAPGTP